MGYKARDFGKLLGMEGFSESLLADHFLLYKEHVSNTNRLCEHLKYLAREEKTAAPEFAEIKRRLGWEFNGMRLHEYYFDNLGGRSPLYREGRLARRMAEEFGSYAAWEKEFRGTAAMRGTGWAILYQDPTGNRLFNFWVGEQDLGHPAGCNPILVMDLFEHAYLRDYGLNRADYTTSFFRNIDWSAAESRFRHQEE